MAQYDGFASFYNLDWGADYHAQLGAVLERLLLPSVAPGETVLDVGCGTGVMARWLLDRGYRVVGVEPSAEMLAFARRKAPEADLIQGSAESIELERRARAGMATFETMSHVVATENLAAALRAIGRAVETVFVFDVLRDAAYESFWNGDVVIEHAGTKCRFVSEYDPIARLAAVEVFPDGSASTTIRERCWETGELMPLLADAGFGDVRRFDSRRDLGMTGDVAVGRTFYQCFR